MAWMARAVDECNPATISVTSPNVPGGGCLQANTVTDSGITMSFARVIVNARSGRILVFGRGLPFGARVTLQLTLRVTRGGINVKHLPGPGSNKRVTFEDQVVTCPNLSSSPFGFPVRPSGALLGTADLASCLGVANSGLSAGNIEVLGAELVNLDTGKVFARPGIER